MVQEGTREHLGFSFLRQKGDSHVNRYAQYDTQVNTEKLDSVCLKFIIIDKQRAYVPRERPIYPQ